MFHGMDAECAFRLSKGRFVREKRDWAREVLQLQVCCMACDVCSHLEPAEPRRLTSSSL